MPRREAGGKCGLTLIRRGRRDGCRPAPSFVVTPDRFQGIDRFQRTVLESRIDPIGDFRRQDSRYDQKIARERLVPVCLGGKQPAHQRYASQHRNPLFEAGLFAHGVAADQQAVSFPDDSLGPNQVLRNLGDACDGEIRAATAAVLDVYRELHASLIAVVDDVRANAYHPTVRNRARSTDSASLPPRRT